ncbi:hypothetical protein [Streptomyces sp. YIM S03343]
MGERLRLADVEHIPADELVPLITDSFDNLVTVAIAEATNGYIPQRTRRLTLSGILRIPGGAA